MAGRGPAPKPAHLRQRTNKKAGWRDLDAGAVTPSAVPPLPPRDADSKPWHMSTVSWWGRVWKSPMASEYLPTDVDGLLRVAVLVDGFAYAPSTQLLAEIRLQEARFGLSPLDRSRLQWEIRRAEEPDRRRSVAPERPKGAGDPRAMLVAVK